MTLAAEYAEPAARLVAWACRTLVQSMLLIVLALAFCSLFRRRSAAFRSAILRVTLVAVVISPLAGRLSALHILDLSIPQESRVPSPSPDPHPFTAGNADARAASTRVGTRIPVETVASVPAIPQTVDSPTPPLPPPPQGPSPSATKWPPQWVSAPPASPSAPP